MEITVRSEGDAPRSAATRDAVAQHRKRFQDHVKTHAPALYLTADGTIRHITSSARQLLEYRTSEGMEPCFFTHVHGKNLYQVMRDVADMVCYGKSQASWLLRLRTGQGRWRWYKASVRNRLEDESRIEVHLDDQNAW